MLQCNGIIYRAVQVFVYEMYKISRIQLYRQHGIRAAPRIRSILYVYPRQPSASSSERYPRLRVHPTSLDTALLTSAKYEVRGRIEFNRQILMVSSQRTPARRCALRSCRVPSAMWPCVPLSCVPALQESPCVSSEWVRALTQAGSWARPASTITPRPRAPARCERRRR